MNLITIVHVRVIMLCKLSRKSVANSYFSWLSSLCQRYQDSRGFSTTYCYGSRWELTIVATVLVCNTGKCG